MSYIYLTTGTKDFLERLKEKHKKKRNLIFMLHPEHALLLDETSKKSVFALPRKYEVIDSIGLIPENGIAVFTYFPVDEDDRAMLEHLIHKRPRFIDSAKGLIALRILRPIKSDTYVFLSCWKDERSFNQWEDRFSFFESYGIPEDFQKKFTDPFPAPTFTRKYRIGIEEE